MNKKLGRFTQWAGEKMGKEARTDTTEDFKALESEMDLRYDGMDKMQKSMTTYVKWMGKRTEDREKLFPAGALGQTFIAHGQDYAPESDYGSCLISIGRAHESIARKQEGYVATATSTWLEGLERSLAQMKEYQAARKKLEQRRIAYDASLTKVQKAKKEDFRVEEELRAQKAKYEEASEDTYRRMMDIKDAEADSIADLTAFLDAELSYYDNCREILASLRREWPGDAVGASSQRPARPRANTARSHADRLTAADEASPTHDKMPILPARGVSYSTPPRTEIRPAYSRQQTERDEGSAQGIYKLVKIPTEPTPLVNVSRGTLRPVPVNTSHDYDEHSVNSNSPPGSSLGSTTPSRAESWSTVEREEKPHAHHQHQHHTIPAGPKKTIPPPINRAKKPPPPPPVKRSALSMSTTQNPF